MKINITAAITIKRRIGEYLEDEIATRNSNYDFIGRGEFDLSDKVNLVSTIGWSLNEREYNRSYYRSQYGRLP